MDPTPDTPPGCLVILTPLSAAMGADAAVRLAHRATGDGEPEVREVPKAFAARFLADELVEALVNTLAAGYPLALDVAVFGYRTGENGNTVVVSLLASPGPPGTPAVRLVPLTAVAGLEVEPRTREGDPRKWTVAVGCSGTASPAAGLAAAYTLVAVWLTGRYSARPPVVVHCTDGEGLDEHYARVARSLGLLATAFGPPRLLHVGVAPGVAPTLSGEWPDDAPGPWAALREVSAELPAEPDGRPVRRAVSVNDWTVNDAWSALFDLAAVEDAGPGGGRFSRAVRELWAHKMMNTPEQWEDAFATDPANGVAAVADGASTGIYCRAWADQLAKRFLADRPDMRDPHALGHWVQGLRAEWRANLDYPKLHWAKQRKIDETGAAATLVGLELGAAAATGGHPWRAAAVGDATLFWVRDGRLHATFPVVAADQFGSAPLLIRSNPGFKTLALCAAGVCRAGDRFLLATDAVASRLFKSTETGPGPDWAALEATGEAEWRAEMDALRTAKDMVNDDCTLVVLRVAAADEPDEPPVAEEVVSAPEPEPEPAAVAAAEWQAEPGEPTAAEEVPAPAPRAPLPPPGEVQPTNESEWR